MKSCEKSSLNNQRLRKMSCFFFFNAHVFYSPSLYVLFGMFCMISNQTTVLPQDCYPALFLFYFYFYFPCQAVNDCWRDL